MDVEKIKEFLKKAKGAYTKNGLIANHDWILFDGERLIARNGYFYIHIECKVDTPFMVNALQFQQILEDDLQVDIDNDMVLLKSGKSKAKMSYPCSIADYGSIPEIPDNWVDIKDSPDLEWLFQGTYKDNLSFANVYHFQGKYISSDGFRISIQETSDTLEDFQIPIGTDKVISGFDGVQYGENFIHFRDGDYYISCLTNTGAIDFVGKYLSLPVPTKHLALEPEILKKTLLKSKAFDVETKKNDSVISFRGGKDSTEIYFGGVKSRLITTLDFKQEEAIHFNIHPDRFLSLLSWAGTIKYEIGGTFLYATGENKKQFIWVEVCDVQQ